MELNAGQLAQGRLGPGSVAAPRDSLAAGKQREYFTFYGSGGEYFRIWIVNILLTIVTVGIYSPWAKVRKQRYICGNLQLANSYFDYLARPLIILRGRLLALLLLFAVIGSQWFYPQLYIFTFLIIGLVTPWLVVRARMFNMRYTSYRNIRFAFNPAYGEAYKTILWFGFLSLITVGLVAPYAHYRRNKLVVNNTLYGNLRFRLGQVGGDFYLAYFIGFGVGALLLAPATSLLAQVEFLSSGAEDGSVIGPQMLSLVPLLLGFLCYFVIAKYIAALVLRITINHTSLGNSVSGQQDHRLGSDWSLPMMLWIYVTNMIAIGLSVGLLIPWAQMRILKYQLDRTWLEVSGELDAVVAGQPQSVSSLGEEIGDVFDVDIGL